MKCVFEKFVSEVFLPFIKVRKKSWKLDRGTLKKHILPRFASRPIASIKRPDVEKWLNELAGAGYAPSTCNRYLSVLRGVFALAEGHGLIKQGESPCLGVSFLKIPEPKTRYLSREEASRLMAYIAGSEDPAAYALRLIILTGARKNEILKAKWENVDFDNRILTVPVSKSGRVRHLPLSLAAIGILRRIYQESGGIWVFPAKKGGRPLGDIYNFWKGAREAAGLGKVRIHDLRHTFAALLAQEGHSLYKIQALLGHSSPNATTRYAHLNQKALFECVEFLARQIEPKKTARNVRRGLPCPWTRERGRVNMQLNYHS